MRGAREYSHRLKMGPGRRHHAAEHSRESGGHSGTRTPADLQRLRWLVADRPSPVLPWVVTSASIRCSSPRGRINRPRSAPACSMAVRMSVSISFSRTISPDTASETLITVPRSRCSTVSAIAVGACGACPHRAAAGRPHPAVAPCRARPSEGRHHARSSDTRERTL